MNNLWCNMLVWDLVELTLHPKCLVSEDDCSNNLLLGLAAATVTNFHCTSQVHNLI